MKGLLEYYYLDSSFILNGFMLFILKKITELLKEQGGIEKMEMKT